MKSEKKRQRKPNFTDEEVQCMLEGIAQEKDVIQSKWQGALIARRKKEAWARVTFKVNACTQGPLRSDKSLKAKWKELKFAVMKEQLSQKKTGGGDPTKEIPFKGSILHIIGDGSDSASSIRDKDSRCSQSIICNSSMADEPHNGLCTLKRHLGLPSLPVSRINAPAASDDDLQPSEKKPLFLQSTTETSTSTDGHLLSVPGLSHSRAGFCSRMKYIMRQALSNPTDDDNNLYNSWLESEIEKNNAKKELIKSKFELIKSNIEKDAAKKLIELQKQNLC